MPTYDDPCYEVMQITSKTISTQDTISTLLDQGDLRPWVGGEHSLFQSYQKEVTSTITHRLDILTKDTRYKMT